MISSFCFSQKGNAILILKDSSEIKGVGEVSVINSIISAKFGNDSLKFKSYRSKEIIGINIIENNYSRKFRYKYIDKNKFPELVEIISINDKLSLYCRIYDGGNLMDSDLTREIVQSRINNNFNNINSNVELPDGTRINLFPSTFAFAKIDFPRISYYIGESNNERLEHLYTFGLPFSKKFEKAISKRFGKCTSLIEKIDNKKFTKNNILDLVNYYNENCYD